MGTLVRAETLAHRIGTDGRVSVKTISGLMRIRGTDGDEARLTVTYRIRAADQAAAERALETGRVLLDRGPSSLEVETPERRLSTGLAWLFGGARVSADITLEVPWGTHVRLETMSGSIEAGSLVGDQKYRTVSGDIRLWGLGGLVEASSISGPVTLDSGGDVRIRASSISGAVKVRARCFYGMSVNTTSGSIAVDRHAGSGGGLPSRFDLGQRQPDAALRRDRRAPNHLRAICPRSWRIASRADAASGGRSSATVGRCSR